MERSSGILLPLFSLPSPYGIGTMGLAAYDFADLLHAAGQRYWQMLPLGPTSYGDSPYQSLSSYAGNPYLIDLDLLIEDGLLTEQEVRDRNWGEDPRHVDYGKLYENRLDLLKKAADRGCKRDAEAVAAFTEKNASWLSDYALFMALKRHFGMKPWQEWPDEAVRLHEPAALARYRELLREDVELFTYIQFLFFRQWTALKSYINSLGMGIIATCLSMWPWTPPMSGRSAPCSVWTAGAFPQRWPVFRRTTSPRTASFGAIRSTIMTP